MSKAKVFKTVIVVTVLSDTPLEFDSLEELGREIDTGDSIGHVVVGSHQPMLMKAVKSELLAMGNDGHFFDYLLDDEQETK